MTAEAHLNHGEQPIARLLAEHGLKPADLVAASAEQLTFKMVSTTMWIHLISHSVSLPVWQ